MPLTDKEREAVTLVAKRFCDHKEFTTHQQLLRELKDPSLIGRLNNLQVWRVNTVVYPPTYCPTILTFHHCSDPELLRFAKRAVQVVVKELKTIFEGDYDSRTNHLVSDFLKHLTNLGYQSDLEEITFGLFLTNDIPSTISAVLNDPKTAVVSFQINEYILNQDPTTIWDNYIQTYDRIAQEDRIAAAQQTRPVPAETRLKEQRPRTTAKKKALNWLPTRWRIVEQLREGGQGWTYTVRRSGSSDQKLYVLKRLKNKSRIERFRREIEALQKLQHPSILRIVEASAESEEPFFVSEFCDGLDLDRANLSGTTLESKLGIFRQVCDAIAAAHKAEILHRDLKPSNVFIRKDGSAVVGDFGLCLDLNDLRERATNTSEAVGARMYIAPELESGRVDEPDASSDVYSLGKVFYFIFSGRDLLREEYAEPQNDLRNGTLGPEMHFVYEVFDKTLKRNPKERLQGAGALLEALDKVIVRVQMKAHVLDMSAPQRCVFCGVGEYLQKESPVYELRLVCKTCGNIQMFTRQPPNKPWW